MPVRNGGGALGAAAFLAAVAALLGAAGVAAAASKFDDVVQPSWANDHMVYDGDLLKLRLDANSGGGFVSRSKFLYGKARADLKLVPGDSAGVVTAFYVSECRPCFAYLCAAAAAAATELQCCCFLLRVLITALVQALIFVWPLHFLLFLVAPTSPHFPKKRLKRLKMGKMCLW